MFDTAAYLGDGMVRADWTVTDLWLGTVALGGNLTWTDVEDVMSGQRPPDAASYDLLVTTLNDRLVERGLHYPMHYWSELPPN